MSNLPAVQIEIRNLYISPGHNFFGHHGHTPGDHPIIERSRIQCLANRGIEGDRFLDFKANYKGQITFFAGEVFEKLCARVEVWDKSPGVLRRNVITAGCDLNTLIGQEFEIQGVRFRGKAECSPCYWMDSAFAAGTEKFLHGQGGLRAQILGDGFLSAPEPLTVIKPQR